MDARLTADRDGVRSRETTEQLEGGESQNLWQSWECPSCEASTWGRLGALCVWGGGREIERERFLNKALKGLVLCSRTRGHTHWNFPTSAGCGENSEGPVCKS